MSSNKTKKPVSTDDYILNPFSGRLIKKGSKTHKQLVAAKLMDDVVSTPQENIIIETDSKEEAKSVQGKMNKNLQKNKVITRRGTKVLKASRRPTRQETIDKVSDYAIESVVENKGYLAETEMTDEEMDKYIRKMIQSKLVGIDVTPTEPAKVISTRRQIVDDDDFDGDYEDQ